MDGDRGQRPESGDRVLDGRQRCHHDVIRIGERGPLLLLNAHDREGNPIAGDPLPQRIGVGEQLLGNGGADDGDATPGEFVGVREISAFGDRRISDGEVPGPGTDDLCRVTEIAEGAGDRGSLLRSSTGDVRGGDRIVQSRCVVDSQVLERWVDDLPTSIGVTGGDGEQVAPERLDTGRHRVRRPLTEGDQDDHGSDADHDAQGREDRPQAIGHDGLPPAA